MKIYEVMVYLHEGEHQSLAYFLRKEAAQEYKELTVEDWANGPNVEGVEVIEREVIE